MGRMDRLTEKIHEGLKLSRQQTFSTRDMSSMDDLTHNFTSDPLITRFFLEKYGQVFIGGKRYTA